MSTQQAVLQVVILRDGLLVGTEVLMPGSYSLGSGPQVEVKLEDPSVDPIHAALYFQNGRSAIQDNNSRSGVYVNGHRIRACEVRSVDEIAVGPFVLKTRVLTNKPAVAKPSPSAEVAALLQGPPAAPVAATPVPGPRPVARGVPAVTPIDATVPRVAPAANRVPQIPPAAPVASRAQTDGNTVPSSRRSISAAPALLAVEEAPPTENIPLPDEIFDAPTKATKIPADLLRAAQGVVAPNTPAPRPARVPAPAPVPAAQPQRQPQAQAPRTRAAAPTRPQKIAIPRPDGGGKGKPRLYFELYWGDARREARSFGPIAPKKPVMAAAADGAHVPLYGFSLPEEQFILADSAGEAFRVFIPPGAAVETQGARQLESDGNRRFITLSNGMGARITEGAMSLIAYVAPPPEKYFANPLKGQPWLAIGLFLVLFAGFSSLLIFGPRPREMPDFQAKQLPPVAVKLIAPEPKKKEEAEKKVAEIKKKAEKKVPTAKKDVPKVAKKADRTPPPKDSAPPPPETKALKALAKLSAAGPATNDVLAAIDKMGSGPGAKNAKNNFKLSGLVGKDPIANAGLGTFGLGGGGRGGRATKGLEMLNGRGGGGIGALGASGFGRGGKVGGTVARASARRIAVQGTIDREAVAKTVNSHLQEVRGCYERALLKEPGLAGKVVLEWTISTGGSVVSARTKSSTLRNGEVEGCILRNLKTWKFPPAKGGVVIVSYPFLFNSVGY